MINDFLFVIGALNIVFVFMAKVPGAGLVAGILIGFGFGLIMIKLLGYP
jgi:hypothetical protein